MKRIFVALPVPENIREKILVWQKKHSKFPVRWIKPENLHITVVPPWYVDEKEFAQVEEVLKSSVKDFPPFEMNFEKTLWGPPGGAPRLIWAEGKTPAEFTELKELLENNLLLQKTNFLKKEKRPARLHLTLARFRPGSLKNFPPLDGDIDWRFRADSVEIFESILKKSGAEYATLETFNFQ